MSMLPGSTLAAPEPLSPAEAAFLAELREAAPEVRAAMRSYMRRLHAGAPVPEAVRGAVAEAGMSPEVAATVLATLSAEARAAG